MDCFRGGKNDKILSAFVSQSMPLYEVWSRACDLTEVEASILRLKWFDDRKLNEYDMLEILREKHGYYYSERQFRRQWRKIKKKIEKIIP